MNNKDVIQYCPFCGHSVAHIYQKCSNCGVYLNAEIKKSWLRIAPTWVSAIAAIAVAVVAIYGAINVKAILDERRATAIKNHLTWIEVTPINFLSTGKKDPADSTSTFWYLEIVVENLGEKTAYVHLKDWTFKSNKRSLITNEYYTPKEIKFSLASGDKKIWRISFVMNSNYHIPPIMSGEDTLIIKARFTSKDMLNREICTYNATWLYSKDEFMLHEDNRHYKAVLNNGITTSDILR